MRLLVIFICIVACSAYSCSSSYSGGDHKVAKPATSVPPDLACKLASLKERYKVGDQPEISAQIFNGTENAVYLVGSLDGSERKERYPHVYYDVSGVEGGISETPPGVSECGVLNPIRVEDFVKVEPGTGFDPHKQFGSDGFSKSGKLVRSRFAKAGSYTFKFYYSTEDNDIKDWRGSVLATPSVVSELWRKVQRVNLTCSLDVNVVE